MTQVPEAGEGGSYGDLAPIEPAAFTALASLVRDGGVVVSTTVDARSE
jgi:hypothetical protein